MLVTYYRCVVMSCLWTKMNPIAKFLGLLLVYCSSAPQAAAQSWNCSTGTAFCILISQERRSWHDASAHCFQRYGGLAHSLHFELILDSSIWSSSDLLVWTGLGWVEGRLQWMSYTPQEETDMSVIDSYARRRVDPTKLCYFMNRDGIVSEGFCQEQLHYVCVMLAASHFSREDLQDDKNPSVGAFVPELLPSGKLKAHFPFLVIEPSAEVYFDLFCSVPINTNCSLNRYRWLKNGAYKPEVDGNTRISDSGEISLAGRKSWILKWIGKVACEVFCHSTGKAYRSKEVILVLRESVSLRVEFEFSVIDLSAMQNFFEEIMHLELRSRTTIPDAPLFQLDLLPFLSDPESSTTTFSFYAHVANLDPQGTLRLNMFLRNISLYSSINYWIDIQDSGLSELKGLFKNISVVMLNYCLEGEDSPNLVFANQITLTRGSNSRFRDEAVDNSSCLYASQQCKSDWFNPASFTSFISPISCLKCMAPFQDYKERCLRMTRPLPFSRSISQCMAEYQNDLVDDNWDLSDWIKLSLDWIDADKELNEALNFNRLWLPIQRRTALGPLRPVWPWNVTNTKEDRSSWYEAIVASRRIRPDWSQLNASLSCLALDTKAKIFQSVSCKTNLPMICVRPRMKLIYSDNSTANFSISGQCPSSWQTSSLIAERNHCYKIFYGEVTYTFDEAHTECEKHDGQLAVATQPSTLAVILNIFNEELVEDSDLWIGLRKTDKGFEWTDKSKWTYEHQIEWAEVKSNRGSNSYGVSLIMISELSSEFPQPPPIKWKIWPKEARLNGFICQKEIFPQKETSLHMHLDLNYRPLVTAQPVPLLVRQANKFRSNPNDSLLEEYENNADVKKDPLSISRLACFLDNSDFIEDYESSNSTINYQIIQQKIFGGMEWRAAEISCETWDEWSPEPMRASWIMSGDPNGVASFSSLIVWLRHRIVKYSSKIHDATFKVSSIARTAFKLYLHDMFFQEFVKLHPRYLYHLMSALEPIAFESEVFPNQQLLVKFRIVINLSPFKGRTEVLGNPWSSNDEATIMQQVHEFFSEKFNSSREVKLGPIAADLDFMSVRSTDFCHGEITSTEGEFIAFLDRPLNLTTALSWPKSTAGSRVASAPYCVTQEGFLLRRRCLGDRSSGLYWESLHDNNKPGGSLCVDTSKLFKKLLDTMIMVNSSQILREIRHHTTGWNPGVAEMELLAQSLFRSVHYVNDNLNGEDLHNLEIIIQQIYNLKTKTLIQAQNSPSFSSNLVGAIENLFARFDTKEAIQPSDRVTSQRLKVELSYMAAESWNRFNEDDSIVGFTVQVNDNRIVKSNVLSSRATYEDVEEFNVVTLLPFQRYDTKETVTFMACTDTRLIDASAASGIFSSPIFSYDLSQPEGWSQSEELFTGNGGMVQVHLNPAPPRLRIPIKILFRPKYPTTEDSRHLIRCVFWNEQMNSGNGGWSSDGCWYEGTDQNGMEVCLCNHLSTFTLLVCRSEKELKSTVHGAILNVITVIGSLTSITGLSLILATFLLFPPWRKPLGHKILFQLSAALIFLLITFTAGVDDIHNVNVCRMVAIFLHYFLLSCFCWMTVEAYYQYRRLVVVFGAYMPRFLLKASIFAWGLPIIPIASVLVYDTDSYTGSEGYCWLRPIPFYSAVLGPVAFLMLINLVVFILVVRSIIAAGRGLRTNQSESKQTKEKLLASFLNFVLLGLTWIFGFLAVGATTNAVIFSYLFCITSSLQGFIIFVLYVGRDPSARKHWLLCIGVITLKSRSWSNKLLAKSPDSKSGNSSFYYDVTSESCPTTSTTENGPTSTLGNSAFNVLYVTAVPWKADVRVAQREPTTKRN